MGSITQFLSAPKYFYDNAPTFIFIVVYLRHFYGLDKAGDVERMLFNTYYTNTGTVYCTYLSFSSVAFKDQTVQNVTDT